MPGSVQPAKHAMARLLPDTALLRIVWLKARAARLRCERRCEAHALPACTAPLTLLPCCRPSLQIVGDDLLCTNPVRVQKAIDTKACNALLLKVRLPRRAAGGTRAWDAAEVPPARPRRWAGSSKLPRAPSPPPTRSHRRPSSLALLAARRSTRSAP